MNLMTGVIDTEDYPLLPTKIFSSCLVNEISEGTVKVIDPLLEKGIYTPEI